MNSRFWIAFALAAASSVLPAPALAEDLLQVFRDARSYDAQYGAARYALQAGLEKLPQGRSLILPTLGLTAGGTRTNLDIDGTRAHELSLNAKTGDCNTVLLSPTAATAH